MPLTRARHARTQPVECPLCKLAVPSYSMGEHFTKKHGGEHKMSDELKASVALAPCPHAHSNHPHAAHCTHVCIARRHEKEHVLQLLEVKPPQVKKAKCADSSCTFKACASLHKKNKKQRTE